MTRIAKSLVLIFAGLALAGATCRAESARVLFDSGLARHRTGDLKEAIRLYSQAIEQDGNFVMAYQMRAAAWQRMQKFPKAIEDYSTVIAIGEPAFRAVGYLNRGIVRNITRHYSEAIPDFSQAIAMDRFMGPAYFHRAIARSRSADTTGTMDDFMRAAKLGDPEAMRILDLATPGWRQPKKAPLPQ